MPEAISIRVGVGGELVRHLRTNVNKTLIKIKIRL